MYNVYKRKKNERGKDNENKKRQQLCNYVSMIAAELKSEWPWYWPTLVYGSTHTSTYSCRYICIFQIRTSIFYRLPECGEFLSFEWNRNDEIIHHRLFWWYFFEMLFWPLFLFRRCLLIALPTLVGDLGPCIPIVVVSVRRLVGFLHIVSRKCGSSLVRSRPTKSFLDPAQSGPAWYRPIHAATYVCMHTSHLLAYNRTYTSINEYSPLVSFEPYSVFFYSFLFKLVRY